MNYSIKNLSILRKILWMDFLLGSTTALIGLFLYKSLAPILGLNSDLILTIVAITLLYALVAFTLTLQKGISIPLLRVLVYANWGWTFVSSVLLLLHYEKATVLGIAFMVLQIVVVGALAYFEGDQILKTKNS